MKTLSLLDFTPSHHSPLIWFVHPLHLFPWYLVHFSLVCIIYLFYQPIPIYPNNPTIVHYYRHIQSTITPPLTTTTILTTPGRI